MAKEIGGGARFNKKKAAPFSVGSVDFLHVMRGLLVSLLCCSEGVSLASRIVFFFWRHVNGESWNLNIRIYWWIWV